MIVKEKISSVKEIIDTLKLIYKDFGTNELNIGELKKQLILRMSNADISIKKSGVTKFSTFLEKKVECISLHNDNNIAILKR